MYNRQLDTFLKVVETGSFSKAAQSAFISPAAVIQQINSLEQNLQTTLFHRTKQGVTLTEAGIYFQTEAMAYIQKEKEIRQKLSSFSPSKKTICVGISMMQKARLLFDLWILFTSSDSSYDIRLINADPGTDNEQAVDIIEGAYYGHAWQMQRDFFKICDAPFGIGVPPQHPLCKKTRLIPEDLSGHTILIPAPGRSFELQTLSRMLNHCGAIIREIPAYDLSVIWDCRCNLSLLAAPMCMQDVFSQLRMKPCSDAGSIPYGFLTARQPSPAAEAFLQYAKGVYNGTIDSGLVPVLD